MKVNVSKTKFIVINGKDEDKRDLVIDGMSVKRCAQYTYLGSPFADGGSTSDSIKINATSRMCQALKFVSFCQKNNDIPFCVKKKVFDAAVMSSFLYGCESWLEGNIKPMENLYNMCIKHLLGVRKNTNNDLCMVELGCPPLKALVKQKQAKFFKSMRTDRENMADDPLNLMLSLTIDSNISTGKYIKSIIETEIDYECEALNLVIQRVNNSESSKCIYYKTINPDMKVHGVYDSKSNLNEIERLSWTKMRLSAHSLAIETGRWNRRGRGRLPIDQRLCQCGQVQTERHVIEECVMSQHLRDFYHYNSLNNLFLETNDLSKTLQFVHSVLNVYK